MPGTSWKPDRRPPGGWDHGTGHAWRVLPITLLAVAVAVAAAGAIGAVRLAGSGQRPPAASEVPPAGSTAETATTRTGPATTRATQGDQIPASAGSCLARPRTIKPEVRGDQQYRVDTPVEDATYDLREVVSTAYPDRTRYPLVFGKVRHGEAASPVRKRLCIVGGKVTGQQSRGLTWQQVKDKHDGDGLRVLSGGWYVVDGLRADNVEDGIAPFGDGFVGRNLYFTYIRDDCIENDAVAGGVVSDSLFDGCSMGLSARPSKGFNPRPPPAGETFRMDGVLLRLQPMPRDDKDGAPDGLGNGQLFKWSRWSNRLVLRNSIFLVERVSMNGAKAMGFPDRTIARNVTLVWTGPGDYPAPVPSGVRVTKDRTVWDAARSAWLARHGYG
jgi:hypothetical protein